MHEILKNVTKVQKAYTKEHVNKLLEEGWVLIHIGQHTDPPDIHMTEFILARTQ